MIDEREAVEKFYDLAAAGSNRAIQPDSSHHSASPSSQFFWNSTISLLGSEQQQGPAHQTRTSVRQPPETTVPHDTSQLLLVRAMIDERGAVEKFYDLAAAGSNRAIQPDSSRAHNDKYFLDFSNVGLKRGKLLLFSPDNATASYVRSRLKRKLVHITPQSGDRAIEVHVANHWSNATPSICQTFSEETALVDFHTSQWFRP
jgi:hypothetical protein